MIEGGLQGKTKYHKRVPLSFATNSLFFPGSRMPHCNYRYFGISAHDCSGTPYLDDRFTLDLLMFRTRGLASNQRGHVQFLFDGTKVSGTGIFYCYIFGMVSSSDLALQLGKRGQRISFFFLFLMHHVPSGETRGPIVYPYVHV